MTDVLEVFLAESGLTPEEAVARLRATMPADTHFWLSPEEEDLLAEQPRSAEGDRPRQDRAHVRTYLREHSCTIAEAARRVGVDRSALQHRIRRGTLASFTLGDGVRIPTWQLTENSLLPHLTELLGALAPGMSPLEWAEFATTRRDRLEGLTVVEWLAEGRPAAPALAVAESTQHR